MMKRGMALVAALLIATPVVAQEVERISGREVAIYNIAGSVEIARGSGSDVVVRIDRGGADADRLRVETGDIRGVSTLRIVYPDDEIVYPEMGRGSSMQQSVRTDGTFGDSGNDGGDRVRIRGSGSGMEAWADLTIEVPADRDFSMYLAVGEIDARGLDGEVRLDTGSGQVTASDISGALEVDTGSGSVSVTGMNGDLTVDTGSGSVEVYDVAGRLVELDTGSGGVTGIGIDADELNVDTGSGSVELEEIFCPDVVVDTGSGSVEIELLTDVDRLEVDTGSGSVTVVAPEDLGARVEIDTGSGGIDLDFPLEVRTVRRDHVVGTLGDGRGEIQIDTGSGTIRFLRGRSRVR